jgi:SulP family sulfate permease
MKKLSTISHRFFSNFSGDLIGGLTAAIVALPMALAFGVTSELGAAAGLYGAIACGIFASLFGGTPGQVSGPTGPMTVVAATIYAANPGKPELVFASAFVAGITQIIFGRIRAGQLIHYIPYPVISGFMTGIGVIIIFLQLMPFAGLKSTGNVSTAILEIPNVFIHGNIHSIALGIMTIAIIYILPKIYKPLPPLLVALLSVTLFGVWFHIDVPRIENIPLGLPFPKIPLPAFTDLHIVLFNGITLALLGSIDSLLTSVVMDKIVDNKHNSDEELVGQGIGNIAASLIGGLPGAGATMRSVVNVRAGGRTKLSGTLHGLILLATLIGLGSVASYIPLACLAGILITVGISILDYRGIKRIPGTPKEDVAVMLVVLFLTVFVDLIMAVLVGVCLASTLFAKKLTDAQTSELGSLESLEKIYTIEQRVPEYLRQSIYIYTFNGPLFFGEVKNFSQSTEKIENAKYLILRFYNVPMVDQTGAFALEDTERSIEAKGGKVLFVGMREPIRKALNDMGVIHNIGMENCFEDFEDAIAAIDAFESSKKTD